MNQLRLWNRYQIGILSALMLKLFALVIFCISGKTFVPIAFSKPKYDYTSLNTILSWWYPIIAILHIFERMFVVMLESCQPQTENSVSSKKGKKFSRKKLLQFRKISNDLITVLQASNWAKFNWIIKKIILLFRNSVVMLNLGDMYSRVNKTEAFVLQGILLVHKKLKI